MLHAFFLLLVTAFLLITSSKAYQVSYRYFTDSRSCYARESEVYAITLNSANYFYPAGRCLNTGKAWIYQLKDTKLIWNVAAGSTIKKGHIGVDLDPNGGCVIADHNVKQLQIQSYDSESVERWSASIGLLGYEDLFRLKVLSDGNYLLVGKSSDDTSFVLKVAKTNTQPYSLDVIWKYEGSYPVGFCGAEESLSNSILAVTGKTYQ